MGVNDNTIPMGRRLLDAPGVKLRKAVAESPEALAQEERERAIVANIKKEKLARDDGRAAQAMRRRRRR